MKSLWPCCGWLGPARVIQEGRRDSSDGLEGLGEVVALWIPRRRRTMAG